MYFDASFKKISLLSLLAFTMLMSLSAAGSIKERLYGSTPPFASIGFMWKETTLRSWYSIEGLLWKTPLFASALSALTGTERTENIKYARALPVLTYHRIVNSSNDFNNVTEKNFRDQMLTLKRAGWETITLDDYQAFMRGERTLPEKVVLITFDDGAKESYYPVDPLFKALGYEGAMFIIVAAANTPESAYYLSVPEIKRMLEGGRFEIGSHSYDGHRPYPTDTYEKTGIFFADKLWLSHENRLETSQEFTERVRNDLTRARHDLAETFGVPISTFAFPLGNETGIEGADNFKEGSNVTENVASTIYDIGFLQTNNQRFTYNYPDSESFIARRIHVDHDWDGERLLSELMQGLPKDLPFTDDFSENTGWIPAWGTLDLGRNNLSLTAEPQASSASTFLDGSALWDNYSFNAAVNWQSGSIFLLSDVENSKTYNACVFSEGVVRLQETVNGTTKTLAEKHDQEISHGSDVRLGIRVHDNVIECLSNYASIVEDYSRSHGGGIGIQVWKPGLGTAKVQVSEIVVRDYRSETPTIEKE